MQPEINPCSPTCWVSPEAKVNGAMAELHKCTSKDLHSSMEKYVVFDYLFHAAVSAEQSNIVHAIKAVQISSSHHSSSTLPSFDFLRLLRKTIVRIEMYGKKILSRKTESQKAWGQHCNAQCITEGLVAGTAVMHTPWACSIIDYFNKEIFDITSSDNLLDELNTPAQVTYALTSLPAISTVVNDISNYCASISVNLGQSATATAQLQLGVNQLTLDNIIELTALATCSASSCQPQAHTASLD
ncbi:hypothetical protein DFJ58DRAFT_837795 [Suillus subalutaceus]|uniref:uncharacterized protein n=1 Tax=Suillus subalutaceus TaxID=48586 RepID=UPI001B8723F0|nr:uncharacterized protein DFJ58DRAFT_837795 [Suillus subalutaceus]KAG1868961.1 hypothetical protein DFJ58DRAFT_837795 [Suillus subalutaceus]